MPIRERTCARRLSTGFGVTSAVILCVLICLGFARGQGTTTKAERGFEAIPDSPATTQGHRYVVAIGVNDYANWPKLATAVSDATGFAELLQKQFGYELPVPPLTDKQVTRQAVESLIDDELRAKMQPDDDLIIFFAGHGTTRTDTTGDLVTKAGFLVPYDAHGPGVGERWSDYINVDELLRMVSSLPAKHILVILDSCHSGLALGAGFSSSRGLEHLSEDMSRKISRKVIASAEGDQLAADSGPLPGHSLFTGC